MVHIKLAVLLALSILLVIFLLQNQVIVEIKFLLWSIEMSRAFLCLTILLLGVVLGWLVASFGRHE